MNRLIIEGMEVDLKNSPININFQINDLGDISTRNASFSNTISLPRTSNNDKIFGMLGVIGSGSRVPYKNLRCVYIHNNITLVQNGYIQVKEMTPTEYKCNILDGIVDLAEKLKGLTLQDLDYIEMNHILNMPTFLASLNNTSGYIYAIGDYGKDLLGYPEIRVEGLAPALFVHTLFDKILTQAGFTYEGDFFSNTGYRKELLTVNKGYDIEDLAETRTDVGIIYGNTIFFSAPAGQFQFHQEKHTFVNNTLTTADITLSGTKMLSHATQRLVLDLSVSHTDTNAQGYFRIYINGNQVHQQILSTSHYLDEFTVMLDLVNGDEVEFESVAVPINSNSSFAYQVLFNTEIAQSSGGQLVDIKSIVGTKIKQMDLLKDVMQRYGLILKVDRLNENHLHFIQLEVLLKDVENALDITDYYNFTKNIDYKMPLSKINTAEYIYGSDIIEPTHDGELIIDNETVGANKTLFKSVFEISPMSHRLDAYSIPIWEPNDEGGYNSKEITNRLFKLGTRGIPTPFRFFEGAPTTIQNPPKLVLDEVDMQYYLDLYFPSYRALMEDYKQVKLEVHMSTIDMLRLDFFRLVYLKQFQAYFYLQKYTNNGEMILQQINKFI